MTVYQSSIDSGRILSISEFRTRMKTDLFVRKYIPDASKTKKMQDFIRHKTDVVRQTSLENLPSGPVDEFEFQESVSSKQRKNWSDHDTKCIEEKFSNEDKILTKRRVFNQDPVLKHILQREESARCYEKMKSYFKKMSMK